MDQMVFFDMIAAESPDLFEFIKRRAVVLESTNSNIISVINTPRANFAAMKARINVSNSPGYRRGQLQFPKIAELKSSLAPW